MDIIKILSLIFKQMKDEVNKKQEDLMQVYKREIQAASDSMVLRKYSETTGEAKRIAQEEAEKRGLNIQ